MRLDAPVAAPLRRPPLGRIGLVTGAALATAAALAWFGVLRQATAMADPSMAHAATSAFAAGGAFVAAWAVMMAAMMLPSATPMIALYAAMRRGGGPPREPASRPFCSR